MTESPPETFPRSPPAAQYLLWEIGRLKKELEDARKEIERLKAEIDVGQPSG